MRNFITGDVRMTAEVYEKGRVRNMEVVSGPKALRAAAIEAMKQYQYAPATKNGKGVASQVRVTIKFWFIP
jgi:protein TonB